MHILTSLEAKQKSIVEQNIFLKRITGIDTIYLLFLLFYSNSY